MLKGLILKFYIIFLPCIVLFCSSQSASSIEIHGHQVANLIEEDGAGVYQELLTKLTKRFELEVAILSITPMKRGRVYFEKDKRSCRIDGEGIFGDWAIQSQPLGGYRMHIMNLKSQPIIRTVSELNPTAKLGGLLGLEMAYKNTLIEPFEIELVEHERQNIEKLKFGRIEALLGFVPDYNRYLDQLQFDKNLVLLEGEDRIYCHNTERGRSYIESFNNALEEMRRDGSYKEIMGTFYLED